MNEDFGEIVLKTLFRCVFAEASYVADIGVDFIEYAQKLKLDGKDHKLFRRKLEETSEVIAKTCDEILGKAGIEEDRRTVITDAAMTALKKTSISKDYIFEINRDPVKIEKKLLAVKIDADDFSSEELEYYHVLINYISRVIVSSFNELEIFGTDREEYLMNKIDTISEKMIEVSKQLASIEDNTVFIADRDRLFEMAYRKSIRNIYNEIRVFGADGLVRKMKNYTLSTAYVQLEVRLDTKDNTNISLKDIFTHGKNFWISGDAGAGKTTCLYWFATAVANGDKIEGIPDGTIPIVIELRKRKVEGLRIRQIIEDVMSCSSYTMPDGWFDKKLKAGKVLFLIDGFDEISEVDRRSIIDWVQKQMDTDDKCFKLFTARPQVEERPDDISIKDLKIQPMSYQKVVEFIKSWHEAVAIENLGLDRETVNAKEDSLVEQLLRNEPLRNLASNPLLCAMISALNFKSEKPVPNNKRELYEDCCKMLLEDRDLERNIENGCSDLGYEKKKLLVAKLATFMMQNNKAEMEESDARELLCKYFDEMNLTKPSAEDFLKFLIQRSGLIQEPTYSTISFVHKSFQEYLCAFLLSRYGDWGYIMEKIPFDEWRETICLAIGYARIDIAGDIVNEALRLRKKKKDQRFFFYAVEYRKEANELDSAIKNKIDKELSEIIPPRYVSIEQVAKAGDIAVKYLKYKKTYSESDRLKCLSILRDIGTENALGEALGYWKPQISDRELSVIGEILMRFPVETWSDPKWVAIMSKAIIECTETNGRITIPSVLVDVFSFMEQEDISKLLSLSCTRMRVLGFENVPVFIGCGEHSSLAHGIGFELPQATNIVTETIKDLEIDGYFESAVIVERFPNVSCVSIQNSNKDYDIDEVFSHIKVSSQMYNNVGVRAYFLKESRKK